MNYRDECVKRGTELLKVLRNKYEKDNYSREKAEVTIADVCSTKLYYKNFEANSAYLTELLSYVNFEIASGTKSDVLFPSLNIISDKIKERIDSGELSMEIIEDEKFIKATSKYFKKALEKLKSLNYSREELEQVEQIENQRYNESYGYFTDPTARGKMKGSLNRGFYTMSFSELHDHIKENNGIGNKSNRFLSITPDDMLLYRVLMLHMSNSYSIKGKEQKTPFRRLRNKNEILGRVARETYISETGSKPEEVLLENSLNKKAKTRKRTKQLKGQTEMKL